MLSSKVSDDILNGHELRKSAKIPTICPLYKEKLTVAVDLKTIEAANQYPYPHIILHDSPLHALIVYIDADFQLRDEQPCENVAISLTAESFSECLLKWSNPF